MLRGGDGGRGGGLDRTEGGGGGGADAVAESESSLNEVQPPVRNAGAEDFKGREGGEGVFCQSPPDEGGGGASDGGGGGGAFDGGGGVVDGEEPLTVDHPDRLNPEGC